MWLIGSGDSENSFGRSSVKLGKRKSLVIVAGGNLAEIPPPLAIVRNCRFAKMCLIRSDDSENRFGKSSVSRKIGKAKIPRHCSGRKSGRNPPTVGAYAKLSFWAKMGLVGSGDSGNSFGKSSVKP